MHTLAGCAGISSVQHLNTLAPTAPLVLRATLVHPIGSISTVDVSFAASTNKGILFTTVCASASSMIYGHADMLDILRLLRLKYSIRIPSVSLGVLLAIFFSSHARRPSALLAPVTTQSARYVMDSAGAGILQAAPVLTTLDFYLEHPVRLFIGFLGNIQSVLREGQQDTTRQHSVVLRPHQEPRCVTVGISEGDAAAGAATAGPPSQWGGAHAPFSRAVGGGSLVMQGSPFPSCSIFIKRFDAVATSIALGMRELLDASRQGRCEGFWGRH